MRRIVFGLALLGLLLAGIPALQAAPLDDARRRERALKDELQQATAELQATEAALARAEDQLAYDKGQLQAADRQQRGARAALAGQAAAMYRSGGLAIADALLDQDPAQVPGRVEMATVLVSRNAQLIEDAQVTGDAYRSVLGRVTRGYERAKELHEQARAAVAKLESGLEEAQAVEARLVRLEQRRKAATKVAPTPPPSGGGGGGGAVSSSGKACILERPYSYVDSWGAPRSGGRSHQGTDVMAPHGARVFAFVNGVVSRESTSSNGGIQLYLRGDKGVEYFYAHLSGYAVSTGARVRAGQLIAYNGQTGNAQYTAPHVHFEVHMGGGAVNPYPHLKPVCG
ncbi:MAG TPA: peptidoglycan DD-metalloendopeptidase family protein [Actinomycetes bacterium]|nr:peptidoglycan DD-metalloendopeptidase family protein [Actinomycetes bacterium]